MAGVYDENGHMYSCKCYYCILGKRVDARLYDFTRRKLTVDFRSCPICGDVVKGIMREHKQDKHAY